MPKLISRETLLRFLPRRHAVRSYTRELVGNDKREFLFQLCRDLSTPSIRIQCFMDDPNAITGLMPRLLGFHNANNYVAFFVKDKKDYEEVGYRGELIVLTMQYLGLQSCWIGGTFSKKKAKAKPKEGEKLLLIIAFGYGVDEGKPHRGKRIEKISLSPAPYPDWYKAGLDAVLLAPSAMNQQKIRFRYEGEKAEAICKGGAFTPIDLGIAKCHFDLGAGPGHLEGTLLNEK